MYVVHLYNENRRTAPSTPGDLEELALGHSVPTTTKFTSWAARVFRSGISTPAITTKIEKTLPGYLVRGQGISTGGMNFVVVGTRAHP
jgi:hypothetical protein